MPRRRRQRGHRSFKTRVLPRGAHRNAFAGSAEGNERGGEEATKPHPDGMGCLQLRHQDRQGEHRSKDLGGSPLPAETTRDRAAEVGRHQPPSQDKQQGTEWNLACFHGDLDGLMHPGWTWRGTRRKMIHQVHHPERDPAGEHQGYHPSC